MNKVSDPDFTFPMVHYGRFATPWDLAPLLYKGGALCDRKKVGELIEVGFLGKLIEERIPLVTAFHETIMAALVGGGSHATAQRQVINIRKFFQWIDENNVEPNLISIERVFIAWANHLLEENKSTNRVKPISVFGMVSTVAALLDSILEEKRGIIRKTRVKKPNAGAQDCVSKSDKQNLQRTFEFGHILLDICAALTHDRIFGPLPLVIKFRNGKEREEWSGLVAPSKLKGRTVTQSSSSKPSARDAWSADASMGRRLPLINLRIQAELLIFIGQTGMNLEQAYKLKTGNFTYRSHKDGYEVKRIYKNRRKGEVEFEIFSSYRKIFEDYLAWRHQVFADKNEDLLFPLHSWHRRSSNIAPAFNAIEKRCEELGVTYCGPSALRKNRQNWLLRRTVDPDLTAEMGQHSKQTLVHFYNRPNHQIAIGEISQFHKSTERMFDTPGPGVCAHCVPLALADAPKFATQPDCASPAGCIFCRHHRDVDTADYMWSLSSYRYLKSLELAKYRPEESKNDPHPAFAVVEKIGKKLSSIKVIDSLHEGWVSEADARVYEGHYHPKWDGFIQLSELAK